MTLRLIALAALICLLLMSQGCGEPSFSPSQNRPSEPVPGSTLYTPAEPPASIEACAPDADTWTNVTRLYLATEESIHELITCGQVQVNTARSLLAIVLASNEELFRGDAFATLTGYAALFDINLATPFAQAEDGRWSMPIAGAGPDSRFWVQFFMPGAVEPILVDPFDLESYLVNVRIETFYLSLIHI